MRARGERAHAAKLTADKVKIIKENRHGWPAWRFAELFGVHKNTIDRIRTGENWSHV